MSCCGCEIELCVSMLLVVFGEKMVLCIFDFEIFMKDFDDFGFNEDDVYKFISFI